MTSIQPGRRLGRSILAVSAGLVAIFVLSLGTDAVLHAAHVYPPMGETMSNPLFALATAYRIVYGIIGCYLAALLAPYRPMLHSAVLGGIGLVFSIAGAIAMGDMGPTWYALAIIAINFPCTFLGGRLREKQLRLA